jgi:two-component system response regulator MprA
LRRPPLSFCQIGDADPDALVVDIGLPDADGRDVVQALAPRESARQSIFLTARDALPDRLAGFGAGGDDYLTSRSRLPSSWRAT